MTMRAAKTIWDMREGRISNLSLQKLLYLSHMFSLGTIQTSLVTTPFEAWDYGPVEPALYHKLKAYGSRDVPDIFNAHPFAEDDREYGPIAEVMRQVGNAGASRLVAITHWDDGAWAEHYCPRVRGIPIPDADILEEYQHRAARSATA